MSFDCGHSFDLIPSMDSQGLSLGGDIYRTVPYVAARCRELAAALTDTQSD